VTTALLSRLQNHKESGYFTPCPAQIKNIVYNRVRVFYYYTGGFVMLFLPREEGQGLVEYALILVLVAIVVIAILTLLGPTIGNVFSRIVTGVTPP
jgi:pilus assembly protein Flp/PilA